MRKLLTGLLLSTVILQGCTTSFNTINENMDEDFVISNYEEYVDARFGITEEIYTMDKVEDLDNVLKIYMDNNTTNAIPEEVIELSHHLLSKYPNYIGTHEENIRNKVVVEYIVNYIDNLDDKKELTEIYKGIKLLEELYNHYFLGSDKTPEELLVLADDINKQYIKVLEDGKYNYREEN